MIVSSGRVSPQFLSRLCESQRSTKMHSADDMVGDDKVIFLCHCRHHCRGCRLHFHSLDWGAGFLPASLSLTRQQFHHPQVFGFTQRAKTVKSNCVYGHFPLPVVNQGLNRSCMSLYTQQVEGGLLEIHNGIQHLP